jgi:manganese/zinc/iron transport system substrate-binding protein
MLNRWLLAISVLIFIASCKEEGKSNEGIAVVVTTTIVSDIAHQVLPTSFKIKNLMGVGVDPHLYKSKSSDHRDLENADLIIYSGLHLEGKMTSIFETLSQKKKVFALSDGISKESLIPLAENYSSYDPHFWTNPTLTKKGIQHLSEQLQKAFPSHKDSINIKTNLYLSELNSASQKIDSILSSIPKNKKVLITAHDAFSYFGHKYDFDIEPVQGVSTVTEAGLRDITNLIATIVEKQIPAIFIESSVSERNILAIQEGCKNKGFKVKIGGTLYSDALGEKKGEAGTYIDFLLHNARTIASGLNH